jgi:hypothetical protein
MMGYPLEVPIYMGILVKQARQLADAVDAEEKGNFSRRM